MKKMTPYLSDKIKLMSLIAIVLVLYIHTYYTEGEEHKCFMFIQRLFGGSGISSIANPLFYLISGYLFFLGTDTVNKCFPKIKKRLRTLFIPYILANTIAFMLYVLLDCISRLSPSLYSIVNFHILNWFSLNPIEILKNIYWEPVAFQLWFVRDMILFVLLSPIIFYILKFLTQKRWSSFLAIIIVLVLHYFTGKLVLWMAIGGIISMSNIINLTNYKPTKARILLMYICTIVFLIHILLISFDIYTPRYAYAAFGLIALWLLYDKFAKGRVFCNNVKVSTACSFSFFIYLIHEPILLIFKKIPLLICSNEIAFTIYFLTIPIIFTTIAIYIGLCLKKYFPKAFSLYTGGR